MRHHTLTAIDIGTNSIKLLVGEKEQNSPTITILAMEEIPLFGLKKGEVYNPENITKALSFLIERVGKTKGIRIKKAVLNINGPHLFPVRSQGLVSVSRADQKISAEDLNRVIQASQAVNLPSNKEILEVVPLEFVVDGEAGVREPVGLEGIRLEAKVLLICVFSPVLENLETAVLDAGIEIEDIVPSFLASARAVLTPEQKELGAAVADIGAGTASISIFSEGNLQDFAVFPIGSANITNDIAVGLRIEISTAERIKRELAAFEIKTGKKRFTKSRKSKKEKEKKEILANFASFPQKALKDIVKSRMNELFSETAKVLKRNSKDVILPAGVTLTGGGASLPGLVNFAKEKFELPVYFSNPKNIPGVENPAFSVCAGLLLCGFDEKEKEIKTGSNGKIIEWLKKTFKTFLP